MTLARQLLSTPKHDSSTNAAQLEGRGGIYETGKIKWAVDVVVKKDNVPKDVSAGTG